MEGCNPVPVPCENGQGGESKALQNKTIYREAVGCLMYLMVTTRPDLSFAVSKAARVMEQPTEADWSSVKRIFKYMKGTINQGILYRKAVDIISLKAYSDANFAGDINTRRSTSGVLVLYANGAIAWSSKLQNTVALSTTEAEFVAASECTKEVMWLMRLLSELGALSENDVPKVFVDNASAVRLVKFPEFHKRSKHIEVRYYYVRECFERGEINVIQISTQDQLADMFTKALPKMRFRNLCQLMGVCKYFFCVYFVY